MRLEENQIMAIDIRKFLYLATGEPGFIKSQKSNRTFFLVKLSKNFQGWDKDCNASLYNFFRFLFECNADKLHRSSVLD